jgi:peptidyl-tRNA hydrolase
VLTRFNAEEKKQLPEIIDKSILEIEKLFSK